jgi:hypothetical protein
MRQALALSGIAFLTLAAGTARAERAPTASMLVHLEITEGGAARKSHDLAIVLGSDGEWGAIDVNDNGSPAKTKVKLRIVDRNAAPPILVFDVEHKDGDHASFGVRGEVDLPAPGKRVVVAKIPRTDGTAEVAIQVGGR